MPREITHIVIHCSASPNGRPNTAKDIDTWHMQRQFKRSWKTRQNFNPELFAIGYHFVILVNGQVQTGRHIEEVGAHVAGENLNSIGICMIGTDKFTPAQWAALNELVEKLQGSYPNAKVIGHRDFNVPKSCPGFDVAYWSEHGPKPESILVTA